MGVTWADVRQDAEDAIGIARSVCSVDRSDPLRGQHVRVAFACAAIEAFDGDVSRARIVEQLLALGAPVEAYAGNGIDITVVEAIADTLTAREGAQP